MSKELGGGSSQACASCKHQRKKCDETCELAPYFPASRYREFQNAHKLFGVSNIQKIINSVELHQRQAAAESILMEGNIRCNDPIHGCVGVVRNLKSQIEHYEKELLSVNQQLALFHRREKQQQLENFIKSSSVAGAVQPSPPTSMFDYQADPFNPQAPTLPDIGDMKISELMYNYHSTMEESADVQLFDIEAMEVPIIEPYQTGHAVASLDVNLEISSNLAPRQESQDKKPIQSASDEEKETVDDDISEREETRGH